MKRGCLYEVRGTAGQKHFGSHRVDLGGDGDPDCDKYVQRPYEKRERYCESQGGNAGPMRCVNVSFFPFAGCYY